MNSKQRVYNTLRFQETDRPARFLWYASELTHVLEQTCAMSPQELQKRYGNDILQPWLGQNKAMSLLVADQAEFTDEFAITRRRVGGHNCIVRYPLQDLTMVKSYTLPDALDVNRFAEVKQMLAQSGQTHFIGADVSPILFEAANNLCSMQTVMVGLADEDEDLLLLFDKLTQFCIDVSVQAVQLGVDWIWLGDDLGSQESMLISPAMFRKHVKPRYRKIIDAIRAQKPDMLIAFHSCGSMYPVIADLVELGINVLNPVQQTAKNMSQAKIKEEFAGKLSLMCGVDTQGFLANATPAQVYEETRRLCNLLGKGGGYIFSASHSMQADTPIENIKAIFAALDAEK